MAVAPSPSSAPALDAQVLWLRHRREIIGGLSLLVLAIAAFALYRFYTEHRDAAAAALLSSARTTEAYQQVVQRYGNTPAAASAYLLLAIEERKEGKFEEANANIQRFISTFPRHEMIPDARMAYASNLESLGKQDEGLAVYQQVAASPGFEAPFAMLEQARILQEKGRLDEARRMCETIISQQPTSYARLEAQQLLRTLKPSVPAAPLPGATGSPTPQATLAASPVRKP